MPFTQVEAKRLILRRFQEADQAAFMSYRNDPEITRFQDWDSVSAPRAQGMLQEQKRLEPGVPGPWFLFALQLKDSGELVGECGLQVLLQDARQAQLNLSLARAHHGQGLATEALNAVLDYAFINLDLHRVISVVDAENARAVKLFERVGMRREGHFVKNVWFKGHWADEFLYAVLQAEWLSRHGLPSMPGASRLPAPASQASGG